MESAARLMCVLAPSSLWLAGSGLVLWLCLRCGLRLSPGTRAVASVLIVLQGWIWFGIPVQIDTAWIDTAWINPAWINPAWIDPQPISIPVQQPALIDAAVAAPPLLLDSRPPLARSSMPEILPLATNAMPDVVPLAGAAAAAIWMAGIVILLWRSIRAFVALSRMVRALPRAPAEWQDELSALYRKQAIGGKQAVDKPLVLKISNVATPMLVQTWGPVCIVFPAWLWESCTAEQRASILLHELEHYRRGDLWRQLAMRLLALPHWFNPVAWWAARQFEAASEAACDEAACGGDPLQAISYSKALLILNERLGIRYAQALAISGGSLTERIRRVLQPEFQKESQMSRVLILSAMIVLAGLATIRIQAAGESPQSANETAKNESTKASAASLIANGGFEEPQEKSDDPQGWFGTRVPKTAGHFLMAVSPRVAHSGKRSAVVLIGESHPDSPVHYNWMADAKGCKPGETYELSGWIKVENAKRPAFIMAQCVSEDGKRIIGYSQKPCEVTGTADWTRVSTLVKVPEGTGMVRIRAGLTSEGNPGAKAWLDDISLVKVATVTY